MELKELMDAITEQKKLWEQMKTAMETAQKDGKQETAEYKAKIEKMEKDMADLDEKITKMQVALNRPPDTKEKIAESESKEKEMQKIAFLKYLAKGRENLSQEEKTIFDNLQKAQQKATMTTADESSLGALTTPEIEADIVRTITEYSPIRELATVRTVSSNEVWQRIKTQSVSASWAGESESTSQVIMKFKREKIPVNKLEALSLVGEESLEDLPFFLSELNGDFLEQFALGEGTSFVSGNGVNKPQGILNASGVTTVKTTVTGKLDYNDIFDIVYSVKEFYLRGSTWLMPRDIVKHLRKVTDNSGQYLWQPAVAQVAPATFAGYPYRFCPDLDTTVATGKNVAIFGDIRLGYKIWDRRGMYVKRLNEKYDPDIGFRATRRIGGQVVLTEAIKILQVK